MNISIRKYKESKSKTIAVSVMTISTFIAMMSVLTSVSEHDIKAQMIGDHDNMGNTTTGLQELQQKAIANGTINLEQTVFKAIHSKINTSLTQATTKAEQSVTNNSFALAAFGGEYGGYFAYQIILGTPNMKFYTVLVDPGNGHILATQKVSADELEKMHMEHSAEVVRGNNSHGDIGFPFLIPH